MIVCADADIERAANAAAYYSMNNAGQVCISVERVYVEAPVYDEFVRRVTDEGRQAAPGRRRTAPGTRRRRRGDLRAAAGDRRRARAATRSPRARGSSPAGTPRRGGGRFYEPTVLVDVDHTMEIMREETFGPTLPIMKVADVEEAVRLANDSPYGLQASVWTRDTARGEQIARRLEAGAVCVNDAQLNYYALNLPMGGWKASGIGTRHGAGGIRKYCRTPVAAGQRASASSASCSCSRTGAAHDAAVRRLLRALYGRGRRG